MPGREDSGAEINSDAEVTSGAAPGHDAAEHEVAGRDAVGRDAPGRDAVGRDTPGRDVLDGVRRGDPAAMAEFFEWCFDRVYSLAVRLLGDRTTAQDVTQDVFVKIQQAAGRLDPDRDPMPWVTARQSGPMMSPAWAATRVAPRMVSVPFFR